MVKKLVGMKGDLVYGEKSLPIALGVPKTKALIYLTMLTSLLPIGILFTEIKDRPVFYYLIFSSVLIITAMFFMFFAKDKRGFNLVNIMYKLILTLSVFAITLA